MNYPASVSALRKEISEVEIKIKLLEKLVETSAKVLNIQSHTLYQARCEISELNTAIEILIFDKTFR